MYLHICELIRESQLIMKVMFYKDNGICVPLKKEYTKIYKNSVPEMYVKFYETSFR